MALNPKDYLTPRDIKGLTGAKTMYSVWNWIREGKIKYFRFGRSYLIEKKDFEAFWEKHKPTFEKYQLVCKNKKKRK